MPEPVSSPEPPAGISAPDGARNVVLVVLDSLRWDSLMAAKPRLLPKLGEIARRWSYATWTSPSHFNLLMGLLPHPAPTHVFASEHYRQDLGRWSTRLGLPEFSFQGMLPRLWLPHTLKAHGYGVHARVSMPVLNPATPLAVDFDTYALASRHNDVAALMDGMVWDPDRPCFHLLNVGETHYPYATAEEPEERWPRIHGVRGVFQRLGVGQLVNEAEAPRFFDQDRLDHLRRRQIRAAKHVDQAMERLFDTVPPGTWIIVTSDHGELFGEGGWFGHGPIHHRKVLEVPFVEGMIR